LVRGLLDIVRHLHRKRAARGQRRQEPRQHRRVVRQPLEHGIAIEHVGFGLRHPACHIGLEKIEAGQPLARLPQHVGGGIEAAHSGVRPAFRQQLGRVAGAAADVDDAPRARHRDLRQQVAGGARALILEAQIELRVPVFGGELGAIVHGGQRVNFLYLIRCGMMLSMPRRRFLSSS
jgi:hypothetical protein